jgi:hypothetical protein
MNLRACLLTISALAADAHWNHSKCPSALEVQAPHVASSFTLEQYEGYYYELLFHDILQAACPRVSCVNTNMTKRVYDDGQVYVHEDWGLHCLGKSYPQVLLNNVTDIPGYLLAEVPIASVPGVPKTLLENVVFANTVVDYKAGDDGWTLQFQCVDLPLLGVVYTGINFYAKNTSEAAYQELAAAAKKSGIDYYLSFSGTGIKTGFNNRRVDHSKCSDEPVSPTLV